jgi:DNA adenine methylase
LKRVGGKAKLLPELKARMPKAYKRFFEPFLGGGALFFDREPHDASLGDASIELMKTYQAVAECVEDVIGLLESHRRAHAQDAYYYEARDRWNEGTWTDDPPGHAAAFIYLNKTCFNGLWRVNKTGHFNTPKGSYENPTIYTPEHLRSAGRLLRQADLYAGDYRVTTASAGDGDFVYCDPPYDPISKTSNFTTYTKDPFVVAQQKELATWAGELRDRGAHVMLSNNDTPFIRELYADFCVDTVQCARPINSKATKRGKVDEVIITTYGATS